MPNDRIALRSILAGLLLPASAIAADPPTPGTVLDNLQTAPRPPSIEGGPVPFKPPAPARKQTPKSTATVLVKRFQFQGNTLFSDAQLSTVVETELNQTLSLLQLYELADRLSLFYREQGYSLASVSLPAQKVSSGVITFAVLEGEIESITGANNDDYSDHFLAYGLGDLTPGDIFTHAAMERKTLLLNDLPGLSVRALIEPGETFGTAKITYRALEQAISGQLSVDNYGREAVGEVRGTALLNWNNPTGDGDRLTVAHTHSEDSLLRYFSGEYEGPLNDSGTRGTFSHSMAQYEVDEQLFPLGIEGDFRSSRFTVSHPVVRSRLFSWWLSGGLSHTRTGSSNFSGSVPGERVTLVEFITKQQKVYDSSVSQLQLKLSSNFHKHRPNASGRNNGQRIKAQLNYAYLWSISRHWQLNWRGMAAWSPDALVDVEKISIGGPNSVRGYAASDARGDYGGFSTLGLQYLTGGDGWNLGLSLFADIGYVGRRAFANIPAPASETLSSAGLGMQLGFLKSWALKAEYAHRLSNPIPSDGREHRVWLALSYQF